MSEVVIECVAILIPNLDRYFPVATFKHRNKVPRYIIQLGGVM